MEYNLQHSVSTTPFVAHHANTKVPHAQNVARRSWWVDHEFLVQFAPSVPLCEPPTTIVDFERTSVWVSQPRSGRQTIVSKARKTTLTYREETPQAALVPFIGYFGNVARHHPRTQLRRFVRHIGRIRNRLRQPFVRIGQL